ncbi:MAG: monovalent cation/H+ antiporter complex subunit F [Devosia sp.]|nr:monovalent cation/H+ antiporter complex subunit F [Devosia sp.]
MTGEVFLVVSGKVALILLTLAVVLTLVRLLKGPTAPDRILALDMLSTLAVSVISVIALGTGVAPELDIALALCLVGFVSTVALARFVFVHATSHSKQAPTEERRTS